MRRIWKIGCIAVLGLGLAGCAWLFTPPQAVLTASVTSGVAPLTVQFDLSASTGQIATFTLTFGDGSPPATGTDITVAVVHTYTTAGTHTATLTVQDARGRTSSASVIVTVSAAATTTVSLGAFPASGSAPVDFWATITAAPGRRIKHIALDYETDGTPDLEADVDFETYNWWIGTHSYTDPGTYTATLTVTDDASPAQTFTATATITVTSPPPVITSFTATPQTGSAPLTVTFDFTAQAGGTGRKIVKYTLSFGDTTSFTEDGLSIVHPATLTRSWAHEYTQTGSFTATLKVWDDLNQTDEESVTIVVD